MTQINFQLQRVPARDWSTERTADIKITLKQCSEETTLTPGQEEDSIRSRQLTQDAGPDSYDHL